MAESFAKTMKRNYISPIPKLIERRSCIIWPSHSTVTARNPHTADRRGCTWLSYRLNRGTGVRSNRANPWNASRPSTVDSSTCTGTTYHTALGYGINPAY